MHGLIFETSICYWQDQPGRERAHTERGGGPDVCRARGAEHGARVRRGHGLAGGRAGPPENRPIPQDPGAAPGSGGRGGEKTRGGGTHPAGGRAAGVEGRREGAPAPARSGTDRRRRGTETRADASRAARARATQAHRARGPGPGGPGNPPPPGGAARGDAGSRRPPGRGPGRRAGKARPRGRGTGPVAALTQRRRRGPRRDARGARRPRERGGPGDGAGREAAEETGRPPSWGGGAGAATAGRGLNAGLPRGARKGRSARKERRNGRGEASRFRRGARGVSPPEGRPAQGRSRGTQSDDRLPSKRRPASRGPGPHPPAPRPAARTRQGPPLLPGNARAGSRAARPLPESTSRPGNAGDLPQRPAGGRGGAGREATPACGTRSWASRGTAGKERRRGNVRRGARRAGTPQHPRRKGAETRPEGDLRGKASDADGPPGKRRGDPTAPGTQGGPREARDAGRSPANTSRSSVPLSRAARPPPPGAGDHTRPHAAERAARLRLLHPAIQQLRRVRTRGSAPRGGHPNATGRARLRAVPVQRAAGCDSATGPEGPGSGTRRGRGGAAPPCPPFPARAAGESRAYPPARNVPRRRQRPRAGNAGPARRDPPPKLGGGRRGPRLGKLRRTPPCRRSGGGARCPKSGNNRGRCLKTRFRRGSGWGIRYPKAPSRIAREGFLTEGASPPTPPARPRRAREGVNDAAHGRREACGGGAERRDPEGVRAEHRGQRERSRAGAAAGKGDSPVPPRGAQPTFCPPSTGASLPRANYTRAQGAASGLGRETPARREAGRPGNAKKKQIKTRYGGTRFPTSSRPAPAQPRPRTPNAARPPAERGRGQPRGHPTPSTRGGQACLSLLSPLLGHRLDSPTTAAGRRSGGPARGSRPGNGKRQHRLGLGHLRDDPERPRSTTESRAARARAPNGRARGAAEGRPSPCRDEGRPGGTPATGGGRGAKRRVSAASTRPRAPPSPRDAEAGPRGRAGFRPPSPSTHHHGGGREERGPRERKREERPHSPRMSVPRPARLGPGPGEREVTTSIKLETEPTERPRPGKARHTGAGGYSKGQGGGPARSAPHSRRRRRRRRRRRPRGGVGATVSHNTTQRRSRATETEQGTARKHGGATTAKHAQGRADHASLPLPARPGREPGSKSQPKKPHRTDDRQRVPTNLVVQSADCRHRKDGSRGRGLSADRPRPPGRQARPQATPHHPISPREPGGGPPPKGGTGHLVDPTPPPPKQPRTYEGTADTRTRGVPRNGTCPESREGARDGRASSRGRLSGAPRLRRGDSGEENGGERPSSTPGSHGCPLAGPATLRGPPRADRASARPPPERDPDSSGGDRDPGGQASA
nr:collagen alpha-1(I) chain-like [Desmodus rotundus]